MPLADVDNPRDPLATLRIVRSKPTKATGSGGGGRWLRRLVTVGIVAAIAAGGYRLLPKA